MDYFGDVSGHFRGLLNNECPVCVVAIVEGIKIDAYRCPKRTIRDVKNVKEAKWTDLTDVQKRRLLECFANQDELRFGYALFTRDKLHTMDEYHYIYWEDSVLTPAWDLMLTGYAYGEILFELNARDDRRSHFTYDRVASKKQSKIIGEHVTDYVSPEGLLAASSEKNPGVQAADCFAGAVAEDFKKGTNWLDHFDEGDYLGCSENSLIKLETRLSEI